MEPTLKDYYEQELRFLRQMGAEFAQKYPKIASRLVLGEEDHPDPHVERLLEGVAFLTGRVQLKIDDDFPEITDALLNIVYPHYLRPIPSMSVAEFQLDPQQGKLTTGLRIPRGASLHSRQTGEHRCRFRTCYETTLWPLELAAVEWRPPEKLDPPVRSGGAVAVVRLVLRCAPEIFFDKLAIRSLRFYLSGEAGLVQSLYEVLLNNCAQILVRDPKDRKRPPLRLPANSLTAVGFEEHEAILPYPKRSFDGYRLLHEYFAFPQKFHFIDLNGLDLVAAAGFKESAEFLIFIAPFEREDRWEALEVGTTPHALRLGCTPVVNLFSQTAEPFLLKQTEYEYPIVPDSRRQRSTEIFSVDEVVSTTPESTEVVRYEPYFSLRHSDDRAKKQTFWYATRRPAPWRREGETDMFITLVNLSGQPMLPEADAITARLTCSNRDLPSRLPFGAEAGDFEMEGGGPILKIVAREKPTPSLPPATGRAAFWRLISHLALNHLSLVNDGRQALQEILQLYNFTKSPYVERQIQGIRTVDGRPHFARVFSDHGVSFARGTMVEIELDEDAFTGSGVYVFSSILERFLGMYVGLNSFCQLAVRTAQRKEVLRRWPPRAGKKILV